MHRKRVFRLICTTHATVLDPSALDDDQVVVVYYLQLSEKRNRSQLFHIIRQKRKYRSRDWETLPSLFPKKNDLPSNNLTMNSVCWAYDAGYLIERGSLVLPMWKRRLDVMIWINLTKRVVLLLDHEDTEFTKGILWIGPPTCNWAMRTFSIWTTTE
jgi:hypothetical protein